VAVLIALALFFIEPQQYRATADVVVPVQATTTGSRIAVVEQAVADFEGALRSSIVAQRVAKLTGAPMNEVAAHIETEQLFGASVVEVGYSASDPDAAEQVVAAASRESLVVLLEAQIGPIRQLRELAQETSDRLDQQYLEFLTRTGILDPQLVFKAQTKRMIQLEDEMNAAIAEGDDARAADLQEELEQRREKWTPLLAEYESLQQARFRANQSRSEAESAYTTAAAALDAAKEGSSTTVAAAVPVARVPQLVRRLLTVVVLATGLAIALIVLLELTAGRAATVKDPRMMPGGEGGEPPLEEPVERRTVERRTAQRQPVKAEPVKEPAKAEPVKEPAKAEPVKAEPIKEPVKAEPVKAEPFKEPVKSEPGKSEPGKSEPFKAEPVTERVKAEPAKAEPIKAEPVKAEPIEEPVKAEPVKAEPPRPEPGREQAERKPANARTRRRRQRRSLQATAAPAERSSAKPQGAEASDLGPVERGNGRAASSEPAPAGGQGGASPADESQSAESSPRSPTEAEVESSG
jgi:hypothetical protein